ncbi:hypothetical protein F0562_008755 [Nyssa sinensis]|uniref:Vta1/callose synthase N-terminal domain-containing protein n=1 Tax=Nyssa sinensis TaxID=561372 RepID=A0A5J5ABA3_9ASTE|nr:hypothetical protein F0562_008755 [Nyssa sinensis]
MMGIPYVNCLINWGCLVAEEREGKENFGVYAIRFQDKKSLTLAPDDNLHLEGFASNVFAKADKQDRAGRADLNTAKTFYAASIFYEILNQFGDLQPELEQKQKYAVWKAADIRKALKEGRKPEPGPPGGDNDLSIESSIPSSEYDLESSRIDATTIPAPESDPSPRFYDEANSHHSTNIPPSTPPYPTANFTSHDFHPPPSTNITEKSTYSQPYHHQTYPQEPQQHMPQNYPSHEIPSQLALMLPTTTPSVPTNTNYPPATEYTSGNRNGTVSEAAPTSAQTYQYDSNYQPSPEKIAEAHKAARFTRDAVIREVKSYLEVLVGKDNDDATVPKAVIETPDGLQAGGLDSKTIPKQDSSDRRVGLTESAIEFMKPRCLWTGKRNKKRQLHPQEKQQQLFKNMSKLSTLEEWLSASPGLNKGCNNGETGVKVDDEVVDGGGGMEDSSSSRSQIGKTKKKVTFRLPEVADVFIIGLSVE